MFKTGVDALKTAGPAINTVVAALNVAKIGGELHKQHAQRPQTAKQSSDGPPTEQKHHRRTSVDAHRFSGGQTQSSDSHHHRRQSWVPNDWDQYESSDGERRRVGSGAIDPPYPIEDGPLRFMSAPWYQLDSRDRYRRAPSASKEEWASHYERWPQVSASSAGRGTRSRLQERNQRDSSSGRPPYNPPVPVASGYGPGCLNSQQRRRSSSIASFSSIDDSGWTGRASMSQSRRSSMAYEAGQTRPLIPGETMRRGSGCSQAPLTQCLAGQDDLAALLRMRTRTRLCPDDMV